MTLAQFNTAALTGGREKQVLYCFNLKNLMMDKFLLTCFLSHHLEETSNVILGTPPATEVSESRHWVHHIFSSILEAK